MNINDNRLCTAIVHRRYFYAFTDLNLIYSFIADIFDVSTDYLYGVSDCSLPLSKLNEIFYDDMTYSELISIVLGLSEEHQKAFMIILECLRKNKIVHPSEMLHSQTHKSLIGLLSVGIQRNKKGLDSSVFTFRENH